MLKELFTGRAQYREDRDLARRMLDGDDRSITAFVDSYLPRLYRIALARMDGDQMAAEEVVQTVLSIAARRIETYRGEATLMSWLTQILRRELVRDRQRSRRRDAVVQLFEDEALIAALAESADAGDGDRLQEVGSLVHMVLDNLPNRYGDVLEWKYIEGLSIKDIEARLGIGGAAVQSLLARARRAFKSAWADAQAG